MILNVGIEDPAVDPQAAVDTDFMERFEKEENENNGAVLKRVVVEKTEGSSDCSGSNLSKGKSDLNNGSKTNFCKCKTNSIDDLHTNWFERRSDPNEGSDTNLSKEKPDSIHRLNLYLPDKKRDPSGIRRKTIYSGINSSRKRLICSSNPKSTLSTSGSSKIASPRNLEHVSGSSRYNISETISDECGRSSNNLFRKSLDPKLSKEDRIINKPFKCFAAKMPLCIKKRLNKMLDSINEKNLGEFIIRNMLFAKEHGENCEKNIHRINPNSELVLELSLEELYSGGMKLVTVSKCAFSLNGDGACINEEVLVNFDKGLRNNDLIVVERCKIGSNIVFKIQEKPHECFKRVENDLIYTKEISMYTAQNGGMFNIPLIDGTKHLIKTEFYINDGLKTKISGKGMPVYKSECHGDFILEFKVVHPGYIC